MTLVSTCVRNSCPSEPHIVVPCWGIVKTTLIGTGSNWTVGGMTISTAAGYNPRAANSRW